MAYSLEILTEDDMWARSIRIGRWPSQDVNYGVRLTEHLAPADSEIVDNDAKYADYIYYNPGPNLPINALLPDCNVP